VTQRQEACERARALLGAALSLLVFLGVGMEALSFAGLRCYVGVAERIIQKSNSSDSNALLAILFTVSMGTING